MRVIFSVCIFAVIGFVILLIGPNVENDVFIQRTRYLSACKLAVKTAATVQAILIQHAHAI